MTVLANKAQTKLDWILVEADSMASGIWCQQQRPISVSETPLSEALLKRLDSWCAWYDRECELHLPSAMRKKPGFDSKSFSEEGLAIAKLIKAEMPSSTVFYADYHKQVTHAKALSFSDYCTEVSI